MAKAKKWRIDLIPESSMMVDNYDNYKSKIFFKFLDN